MRHIFLLLIALCVITSSHASGVSIFVYYPSIIRPPVMQQKLIEQFNEENVVVFGRFQDFVDKVNESHPDIIITRPQSLNDISGYTSRLNGMRNGSKTEKWVFISIDNTIKTDSIGKRIIGTIDFLGRLNTERFVSGLLNRKVNLTRAVKIEDLLTMMTFNKVDAVFVSEGVVEFIKKTSHLNLVVTPIPDCNTGIITCAIHNGTVNPSLDIFLNKKIMNATKTLEIDEWKPAK